MNVQHPTKEPRNVQHPTVDHSSYVDQNPTLIKESPATDPLLSPEDDGDFVNERKPIKKGCYPE